MTNSSTTDTFATGSYLQDEDKDLWEELFDPAVLPDLKKRLECSLTPRSAWRRP
ncbi:hypothetical protein [Corynebacterium urealyticum]|uniref:hypothetical protein n=1 Tax=Corynebacterium urealyticum TaxID=43771 RepID=UPI001F3E693B|nr:hypothetical protein [Corynebacterium urealyticum]